MKTYPIYKTSINKFYYIDAISKENKERKRNRRKRTILKRKQQKVIWHLPKKVRSTPILLTSGGEELGDIK